MKVAITKSVTSTMNNVASIDGIGYSVNLLFGTKIGVVLLRDGSGVVVYLTIIYA